MRRSASKRSRRRARGMEVSIGEFDVAECIPGARKERSGPTGARWARSETLLEADLGTQAEDPRAGDFRHPVRGRPGLIERVRRAGDLEGRNAQTVVALHDEA